MKHVLEHLGRDTDTFLAIWKELYRVAAPGATVRIVVPHPRHQDFLQDPTHVRAMNENSWLYYTDWFWYLGWFEHRFAIAAATQARTMPPVQRCPEPWNARTDRRRSTRTP